MSTKIQPRSKRQAALIGKILVMSGKGIALSASLFWRLVLKPTLTIVIPFLLKLIFVWILWGLIKLSFRAVFGGRSARWNSQANMNALADHLTRGKGENIRVSASGGKIHVSAEVGRGVKPFRTLYGKTCKRFHVQGVENFDRNGRFVSWVVSAA